MGLKVYKKQCENCLLTNKRIVSPNRAVQVESDCLKNDTYFVCHKSMGAETGDVCCKSFFDKYKDVVSLLRLSVRIGMVEEVDLPKNGTKYIAFNKQRKL